MVDFTKKVTGSLEPGMRYISVTESDVATGDVIRVYDSLGRFADTITIEANAASNLQIRINSRVTRHRPRQYPGNYPAYWEGIPEINDPVEFETKVDLIDVGNATTAVQFALNDITIGDIEVTYSAGTFTILLS